MGDKQVSDRSDLEKILRLPEFDHPVSSPDGETVAFFSNRSGRTEIHLLNLATGTIKQLTDGGVSENTNEPLYWNSDSRTLYFHHDNGGDEQYDVCRVDLDGSITSVISKSGRLLLQDISENGQYLLYTATNDESSNLFRWDLNDEHSIPLTDFGRQVRTAAFNPNDGGQIAFSVADDGFSSGTGIYVMDVDEMNYRRLNVGDDSSDSVFRNWGPNGNRLLFSDDVDGLTHPCIYDLTCDHVRRFNESHLEELPFAFLPDGNGFVGVRFDQAKTVPFLRDNNGTYTTLADSPGVYRFPIGSRRAAFINEQTVLLVRSSTTERYELLAIDLTTNNIEVFYSADDEDHSYSFIEGVYERYESYDGTRIGGVLYEPNQASGSGVVMVHGGPHTQSYQEFNPYIQYLVHAGYTVFQPNFRGSKGRGRDFRTEIHGDWGGAEQKDIAAAGRWLGTHKNIDIDRIAIYGRSFGGYCVFYQMVTEPNLWAAGIAWAGVADLHTLYMESPPPYRSFLRTQMGDPDKNRSLWRRRSPLTHVDKHEQPILIAHGKNDPRCPVSQARQYRNALEDRGWTLGDEFEYLELESEGHDTASNSSKVRLFDEMISFLNEKM